MVFSICIEGLKKMPAVNAGISRKNKKRARSANWLQALAWLITLILIQCTPFDFRGRIVLWAAFDKLL